MQLRFTAYNCGTGYDRNRDDVVAQLNKETISAHMITDGVGSRWWQVSGKLGGVGADANVEAVVSEVKRRASQIHSMVLNMCGWSRGAVTCIKIANKLYADPATSGISVNSFAIDPVPGGAAINNHMWQSIDMTGNIKMCSVVLSQHDRRSLFAPYYPPVLGPFTDVDIMPGDHSTIVEDHPGCSEAYELVKDMAKRFLMARGTVFKSNALLTPAEILKRYALIAEHFDDYAHLAKGAGTFFGSRFKGARPVKGVRPADDPTSPEASLAALGDKTQEIASLLPIKPRFFLNEHHRMVFQALFPNLTNEIDYPPERAFSIANHRAWSEEFMRLMESDMVEQFKMFLVYYLACQAKQHAKAAA